MNDSEIFNKKVESIEKIINGIYRDLDTVKSMLEGLGKDMKRDLYKNIEGMVGTYDGTYIVDSSGNKYEVPGNYAAKSRLVYGDSIKMIEDEGKTVFKQIQKVERLKTEGILSKKEGKWYILTNSGSYKISDIAADFNHAELNDEAVAFIPAQNLNAPFATLDRILNKKADQPENIQDTPASPRPATTGAGPTVKPVQQSKPVSSPQAVKSAQPGDKLPAKSYAENKNRPNNQQSPIKKPVQSKGAPLKPRNPQNTKPAAPKPVPPVAAERVSQIIAKTDEARIQPEAPYIRPEIPETPAADNAERIGLEDDDLR